MAVDPGILRALGAMEDSIPSVAHSLLGTESVVGPAHFDNYALSRFPEQLEKKTLHHVRKHAVKIGVLHNRMKPGCGLWFVNRDAFYRAAKNGELDRAIYSWICKKTKRRLSSWSGTWRELSQYWFATEENLEKSIPLIRGVKSKGFVYFILENDAPKRDRWCKIGYTSRTPIRDRIAHIQTACPRRLELVAVAIDETERLERALHKKFQHRRGIGEWFRWSESMRGFIANRIDATNALLGDR